MSIMLKTLALIAVTANVFFIASSEAFQICGFDECSGENEECVECPSDCSPQTCDTIGKTYPCPKKMKCKPDCRCKTGFYRNFFDVCIPEDECPTIKKTECDNPEDKCTGSNEVYDKCPGCCPQTCDTIGESCPTPNPEDCEPACRCKPGYYRNDDNICVCADECPTTTTTSKPECDNPEDQCTGSNEVYDECPGCCPQTCDTIGESCPTPNPEDCEPACRCKPGYYRNDDNICVCADECPTSTTTPKPECENPEDQCTGSNEVYDECPGCCPQTCDSIGESCPTPNPEDCEPACRCKPGYYRNDDNICVCADECPTTTTTPKTECDNPEDQCTGSNEVYDECPGCCPQTCDTIGESCPTPNPEDCEPACRCKPGYYRNDDNVCVCADECPATTTTPECG